ncbi:MAG: glucosaminidase domain-containing protein [Owenweeksia sp.]
MKAKLFGLLMLLTTVAMGAEKESVTISYIEKYRDVAIREMKKFGVPASITLAQGILESGSGQSYLAKRANNHFGIKCHLDWDGKRVYQDDDEKNECFRAYGDPDESFRDHSLFLKNRSRYASLFKEDPTDYKAWAHGLKKAGYATNRKYPTLLIGLIERYELHKYDLEGFKVDVEEITKNEPGIPAREEIKSYQVNVSKNYVQYVTAKEGDSFESISKQVDVSVKRLLKYNELEKDESLKSGQRVYLQPKRKKAYRDFEVHTVQKGETLHGISQQYGVKVKYLRKRNNLEEDKEPVPGMELELR